MEAFPPEEYLAPQALVAMDEKGEVDFLALYDDSRFIGFMVVCTYEHMNYLSFLAIASEFRSCGYGGQALALLETLYPGKQQVVDLEKLDDRAENQPQRVCRPFHSLAA